MADAGEAERRVDIEDLYLFALEHQGIPLQPPTSWPSQGSMMAVFPDEPPALFAHNIGVRFAPTTHRCATKAALSIPQRLTAVTAMTSGSIALPPVRVRVGWPPGINDVCH